MAGSRRMRGEFTQPLARIRRAVHGPSDAFVKYQIPTRPLTSAWIRPDAGSIWSEVSPTDFVMRCDVQAPPAFVE